MTQFTVNLPSIRVKVRNSFLNEQMSGFTEAYLVAVTSINTRPLFFTVHLETGAVWSRLPIHAIYCERYGEISNITLPLPLGVAQPYSCLPGSINVITYEHLKHCRVKVKCTDKIERNGTYLFTVDVNGDGLAEDPTQHKTHNVIVLDSGQLITYPNNMILFTDEFFTEANGWPNYRRTDKFWIAGG
jgi:hypothetical protein